MFGCAGGIVQIEVGSEALWRGFAPLSGPDPAYPPFATSGERVGRRQELIAVIEAVLRTELPERGVASR